MPLGTIGLAALVCALPVAPAGLFAPYIHSAHSAHSTLSAVGDLWGAGGAPTFEAWG